MAIIGFIGTLLLCSIAVHSHPHLYSNYYHTPYYYPPSYPQFLPSPSEFSEDPILTTYLSTPNDLPTLNILAEVPFSVNNHFTVVPMLVVAEDNMRLLASNQVQVQSISTKKPTMTVKLMGSQKKRPELIQCTPAVKIILQKPIEVYSLKSSVFFPSEVEVVHQGLRIPISIGAIIAPIRRNTYVSIESPIAVSVVYAVPTRPVVNLPTSSKFDYVINRDAIEIPGTEAVVVESEDVLPPKNVTILDFPDKEASPELQVDEDNDELVNRNPPILLAPAGIVQSTQPLSHVEPFTNSKESPILIQLREEALKRI